MDPTPATTRVRYTRVRNIDSDRLRRRLAYLQANRADIARACDSRNELSHFARELIVVELELVRRFLGQ